MKLQQGFTLIELIVSITMSIFILFGLVSIMLATDTAHRSQVALNSIEDASRDVSRVLSTAIHFAGYIGCARFIDQLPLTNHTQYVFTPQNSISEEKGAFTIRRMGLVNTELIKTMRGHSVLYVSNNIHFSKDDVLIISDCQSVDIFLVKEVLNQIDGSQKIISQSPLSILYEKNAQVSFFEENTYFVADTGRFSFYHVPVFALYMQDIYQHKTELVEGVDTMRVVIDKRKKIPIGASIELQLSSLGRLCLQKEWFIYAAIQY